jgi:uncharacterized protein with ParB-like and HNH nuclease domain
MGFEAKEKAVDKLLNDAIYYIPRNQRRYVWNSTNWTDMYDDILLVADQIADSHFIGSIVLKDEGKEDGLSKYTVIDGQQRILTLTIYLISIMFMFKKRNLMNDFGGTQKYLVAKDIKNNMREIVYPEYHLTIPKMVENVLDMEQKEIERLSVSAFATLCLVSEKKDKNVIDAFKFFANKLSALEDEKILQIRDALISISYVNIISSTEEDSYTIFEILNARGLDLEDYELLKNYIMRYLQPIETRDDAKKIWEEMENNLGKNQKAFLRHYALHKYNYNNYKKQGLSVYKTIEKATKGRKVNLLLNDLKLKAQIYYQILSPEEDSFEYPIFNFFRKYKIEQIRPLIMSLKHQKILDNISDEKYKEIVNYLYTFIVAYKIIGEENSNKLSDTIYKYANLIENDYSDNVIQECIAALKEKMPTLDVFTNSLKNLGWSNHWGIYKDSKKKERCQVVLEMIEEYISDREINIPVTIEHILPDCECIGNAQIGNLFYLEESLNKQCADRKFEEKIEIYEKSSLMSPLGFAKRYKNKNFNPDDRTVFLAKLIYNNILRVEN